MRFYRLLLRLYPLSFRADYEAEMEEVFAERQKRSGPLRTALAGIGDVVPSAMATHWDLLVQDLRYTARSLGRAPGFLVTAVLVAALGIGANTAAFSLADFVLMRPLPLRDPGRLMRIWQSNPTGYNQFSPANFRDFREQARSFQAMGAWASRPANLVGIGEPRRLETIRATPELLPLLGIRPLTGRLFTPEEAAATHPVVLSYALWQSQFGGARDILGRVVRLDGVPHTVVAVMPASFHFPHRQVDAWTPLVLRDADMEDRGDTYLDVVARIRSGVAVEQARRELTVIAARLEKQFPENRQTGVRAPLLHEDLSRQARVLVLALCGAALCILLLSCANLAGLFLARGAWRARELAVRSALGAGRERLVRQLITESFAVAAAGGAAGLAIAWAGLPLLARLVPSSLPIAEAPSLDGRVLALAASLVVLTALAFGLLPAVRASRGNDFDALRSGARGGGGRTRRLRAALVIVEIGASVVLLVSAGLLVRAVWNIRATAPGFRPEGVLTLRTALPLPKYETVAVRARFFTQVLDDVRALPGVRGAAYVTGLPMQMRGGIWTVKLAGVEPKRDGSQDVSLRFVTPQFFTTLRIPLQRGRDVSDGDTQTRPFVAVVSESFARRHWPGQDPIGKRFEVGFAERAVAGVVGDIRVRGLERSSEPQVYLPYQQVEDGGLIGYVPKELVVRTDGDPQPLLPAIVAAVRRADPEQPVSDVRRLSELIGEETVSRVVQLRVLGAMALIALLIAAVGIHGLLTFTVSRRSQELGVRRVLGAQAGEIARSVLREGLVLGAIGIAAGFLVAWAAARAMSALLFGVRPADPLTFLMAGLLCMVTVLAGCIRPALRAARIEPAGVLRAE